MTLMFIDDKEKNNLNIIGDALRNVDKTMYNTFESVYGSL